MYKLVLVWNETKYQKLIGAYTPDAIMANIAATDLADARSMAKSYLDNMLDCYKESLIKAYVIELNESNEISL